MGMKITSGIGISALLAWLAASPVAAQQDWPTYRGDLSRSGVAGQALDVAKLESSWVWRAQLAPDPAWPGPARWDAFAGLSGLQSMRNYDPVFHPIAVADSVWFGSSSEDTLFCLDAASGRERWRLAVGGAIRVAPQWVDGYLYFGADDGFAYCVDAARGELRWRVEAQPGSRRILNNGRLISIMPVRTGVAVAEGKAYFGASLLPWESSVMLAVDARTGALDGPGLYRNQLGTGFTLEGAMALARETLVVPQGRIAPLLFTRDTGAAAGALQGGGGSFCLVTDGGAVLHGPGNKDGWLSDSSSASGQLVATYEKGRAMVIGKHVAYMLSASALGALDRPTKSVLWSVPTECSHTMLLTGEQLVLGGEGRVEGRRAWDGGLLWEASVIGGAHGLAVAQGRLLVATDEGLLYAFTPGESDMVVASEPALPGERPALQPLPRLSERSDRNLIDRFVFQEDTIEQRPLREGNPYTLPWARNLARGGADASIRGLLDLRQAGKLHCIALNGRDQDVSIATDLEGLSMPEQDLSLEAWVRIDRPQEWGGIISASQDNGDYERGWILGYRRDRFGIAVKGTDGQPAMGWTLSPKPFTRGGWHHVVGTYDGTLTRLFVDGVAVAESRNQSGPVLYPDTAFYHVGAYRDADEYFRLEGQLHEVALYKDALSPREVQARFARKAQLFPASRPAVGAGPVGEGEQLQLALTRGPRLRFTGSGQAEIEVTLDRAGPLAVVLASPGAGAPRRFESKGVQAGHTIALTGLAHRRLHTYHLEVGAMRSETFECDTHFDFSMRWKPGPEALVEEGDWRRVVLEESGQQRGVLLLLGASEGETAMILARHCSARVIAVTSSHERARALRQSCSERGYSPRVSVVVVPEEGPLGLPRCFANLLVSDPDDGEQVADLLRRGVLACLRPFGGEAYLLEEQLQLAAQVAQLEPRPTSLSSRGLARFERGALQGAGGWTHMYGAPDNSAFGGEALAGARSVQDLELSWIGRPGPRYQTDRQNRKPSPLSVGGRLFVQGLERVIALDAMNGSMLWNLELPELQRFNIPRASSNWCADDESVFLAMGDRVERLDAASGHLRAVYTVEPGTAGGELDWGYVASVGEQLLGSAVRRGAQHTEWWGSGAWYDAHDGEHASKVVSEGLFSLAKESGSLEWSYSGGRVLDVTISQADDTLYFVEARDPEALAFPGGRLAGEMLWRDLHLVALDVHTGEERWRRPARPLPGTVAFYLAHAQGRLVMLSSHAGEFGLYTFDAETGESLWRKKFAWEADHHGKHLSRPAIVGGEVYVRPLVFDLASGEAVARPFPEGHQCGTYTAAAGALFLRAGELCVWDSESGGASRFTRLRPDCWISTIPASGMLLSPEGGGGCSCGGWLEASMGFLPRAAR